MTDPPDDERALQRLRDEALADEAARSRARQRWLRQQAAEETSLVGTLVELAERGSTVTVHTVSGRRHHGVIAAVAADFCSVDVPGERAVHVALEAVATLRLAGGITPDAGSARRTAHDVTLAELLAGLAPERPDVSVVITGEAQPLHGQLLGVGEDVLTLRLAGDPATVCHVGLGAVTEVIVRAG